MHALGLNRKSYFTFLRRAYGMLAWEAMEYIHRNSTPPPVEHVKKAIDLHMWCDGYPYCNKCGRPCA